MKYFFLPVILVMVIGCSAGEVKDITYDLEIHHGELEEKQSLEANKEYRFKNTIPKTYMA